MDSIIPPLAQDDYIRLRASIERDGQRIPILVNADGEVIDGVHRLQICRELGIEPWIEQRDDLSEDMIISLNLARRHLTFEQKNELRRLLRSRGKTQREVGQLLGLSRQAVGYQDIKDAKVGIPYIRDQRYKLTRDDKEEIREQIDAGKSQVQVAADFGITQPRVSQIINAPAPIETPPWPPEGRYRCVVIDPPWPVKKIEREARPRQEDYLDYPTMTLEEIAAIPIPDFAAADGCHIYLWTTHKHLHDALHIFEGWGARYECLIIWCKKGGISPYSWQYNAEMALFGRIGKLTVDRMGLKLCFHGERREHSTKPEEFYQLVAWASPPPRLDMFARQERDGFEAWGAEVAPMGNR